MSRRMLIIFLVICSLSLFLIPVVHGAGPLSVSSRGFNRLDLFSTLPGFYHYHKEWNNGWLPWESVKDSIMHPPGSSVSIPGTNMVFVVSTDISHGGGSEKVPMIFRVYNGNLPCDIRGCHRWSDWKPLYGDFRFDPTITSSGPNRLDVFGIGTDGALYHKKSLDRGEHWSPSPDWERVGGAFSSSPSAVSWGPGRIDIFGRGIDTAVWHFYGNGDDRKWGYDPLGGSIWEFSGPAASSWGPNRLDVFGIGTDGALYHTYWNGGPKWIDWKRLPYTPGYPDFVIRDSPTVVSWGRDRIDIFVQTRDAPPTRTDLYHTYWNGRGFVMPWEHIEQPPS